jgi:DNA-directed RNA polymerase subunit beta'
VVCEDLFCAKVASTEHGHIATPAQGERLMSIDTHLTPDEAFETLKKNTVDSIQTHFPFEGRRHRVELTNIHVDDKLQVDDIQSQTDAKDKEGTWGVPVKADLRLVDKITGQVVDSKKNTVLARLPKLTNRYSYIVRGNEYQVDHLFRLKSGVYARVQDNGDLESEFNLAKSPTGRGFSLKLDQKTKKMSLKYGDAHIPLYPVLKSLGVSDDSIEKSWGKELFATNKPKTDEKFQASLASFYKRTHESGSADGKNLDDLHKHVNDFFSQTAVRPDTTKITLGKPYEKVNGEVLFEAAHKLLGVSRGTHRPDDRDSLAFKEVVSAEDFIPEKIQKHTKAIKAKVNQVIDSKKTIGEIISTDLFNKPVHDFFQKGGSVAERSDQTNPIQMLSAHRKTTLMSKDFGGIKNDNSVTQAMQAVNQSHIGFLDPMHTPESERTGITLHLASGVRKNGRDLEIPVYDLHTGKAVHVKAPDFHTESAVLPDQVRWENGKPIPIHPIVKMKSAGGDIEERPFKEARYVMPSAKSMFNYSSNLIPFLPTDNGNRVMMADKQMEQAIGLKHREVPLVQSKSDHPDADHSFERLLGHFVATRTPVDGTVHSVKGSTVVIQGKDGKKHQVHTYDNFPLNDSKGMLHSETIVAVGDKVKANQVVADNNYTKGGDLAIGTNLHVGYLPYKGYNFEDGIVISESASKQLTSEHLHKKHLEIDPDRDHISKAKFQAWSVTRSSQMKKEHMDALDDNGVVRIGQRVQPGQVLVAAIGKNDVRKANFLSAYGKKRAFQPFRDKSLVWDEDHEGVVTKIIHEPGGRGVRVLIRTEEPAVIGDKLTGRHGNKGIITQILKNEEMPYVKDANGERKHLEVLLSPSGVPSRINPGQLLETAAGKIAQKTGKPYLVNNFAGPNHDYRQQVVDDLKKHGLSDEELVYDPSDSRKALGSVIVGPQYILKLKHQVEKKLSARGGGTDLNGRSLPYDVDKQPVKGGDKGGQGFGALEMYSLLGHNARHNIREMATYKSDEQDMLFWNLIQTGHEPPPPKVPFAYQKFEGLLKGLGVNVTKEGSSIRLHPMTTKEVLAMAGNGKNEIKDPRALRAKDLQPIPGGLFDPHTTGGVDGDKWSFIRLSEPMPNPLFVGQANKPGPIPTLLGMKMKEFEDLMHGRTTLHGMSGGRAVENALKKVDVHKEVEGLRTQLRTLRGADLDRANKKLKFLLALKDLNLKPAEAYVMHAIPVVPPKFRPATPTDKGDVNYAPLNGHYKNVSILNGELKKFDHATFSPEHAQPLRSQLWEAMKGLQSVGNYKPVYDAESNRELAGILNTIAQGGVEGQPKEGYFQSKLIKRKQNLSMRSTIVPEPNLGLDEVGLPRGAAMEMYKPYVVAHLARLGYDPLRAQEEMKKPDSQVARRALEAVVSQRPVLLKRDPVLHKFGIMAFKPKLIEGKAIQIHPLVTGGFNADFDGDTMAATVPMSHEAVEEAKKMMPSRNLFSPTTGRVMYMPGQDALLGLHLISKWGKATGKKYGSWADLEKAVEAGHARVDDVVHVTGHKQPTTFGRLLIESRLPRGISTREDILYGSSFEVGKKTLAMLAPELAKKHTAEFPKTVNGLKDLGNDWAYKLGFSFGLKDLKTLPERDGIIHAAEKKVAELRKTHKDKTEFDQASIKVWMDATAQLEHAQQGLAGKGNRLATMVASGARGSHDQLRQMVSAPMLVKDSLGKTVPYPIKRSFSEGLDVGDFWISQHGARKGIIDRSRGTAEPGSLTKDIINASMSTLIVSPDCKTNQGVLLDIKDGDIHDRFTAAPYKLKDGHTIPAGELITPELLTRFKNSKHEKVLVRSPLKCGHGEGICAKCYGLSEAGVAHDVGANIGVLASQAMGEPSVQLSMRAFHTGGVAGTEQGKTLDALTRFRNLLEMPRKVKDEATLSSASGKITAIKKDAVGGVDVFVGDTKHYVPHQLVRDDQTVGHEIRKGDALSLGVVNPHRVLETTKDIHAVQHFLTNELHGGLFGPGLNVRKRNIEVAVRSLTNLTKVQHAGNSDWSEGDVLPRTLVEEHNRSLPKGHKAVEHTPILKGTGEIPHLITKDWMQRMNYQQLHTTVQQAAAQGQRADLHSYNPIPALARGSEFGKPPHGKKPGAY